MFHIFQKTVKVRDSKFGIALVVETSPMVSNFIVVLKWYFSFNFDLYL